VLLCFALLGSLIAWGVMQQCYPFYTVYSPTPNAPAAPRGPRELDKEQVFVWNMRLGYGLYGTAVGACLGLGFAFARRSILWSAAGLLTCGGFGALAGYFGGDLSNKFFEGMGRTAETNVIIQSMVGQGLVWTLCGLGFGLSLALLSSGWVRRGYAVLAGIVSGLLAGALHAPLHTAIFAENDINLRLPTGSGAQLMWLVIPAAFAALLLAGLKPTEQPSDAHKKSLAVA
jgi:hypothetical protein